VQAQHPSSRRLDRKRKERNYSLSPIGHHQLTLYCILISGKQMMQEKKEITCYMASKSEEIE